MLTIKYEKKSTASFVSHIDVLRTLGRIFARADVKVGLSEGFNPHMLIFCSPANAVGVNSECEYVTIASSEQKDICEKFNTFAPEGFKAVKHFVNEKNPNLAKHVTNAEYIFRGKGIGKADFNRLLKSDVFEISYEDKNGVKTKDFRSYVISLEKVDEDAFKALLKFGNDNLRPDRFLEGFFKFFDMPPVEVDCLKTQAFCGDKTVDEFLETSV